MQIDLAHRMVYFMRIFILTWVGTTVAMVGIALLTPAPAGRAITVMMTSMIGRIFYPEIHAISSGTLLLYQCFSGLFLIFLMVSSKVYMFLYMWCCNLIRTGLVVWNCRVEVVLLKGIE